MPRPQKSRRICCYPDYWSFAPDQDTANDTVIMSLDEFETIRQIDYFSKTQEECASEMNVARTTVTAIYDTARKKLAQALVEGCRPDRPAVRLSPAGMSILPGGLSPAGRAFLRGPL